MFVCITYLPQTTYVVSFYFVHTCILKRSDSDLPDFQVKPSSSKASLVPKRKKRKKNDSSAAEFEDQTENLDEREIGSKGTIFAIIYYILHILSSM